MEVYMAKRLAIMVTFLFLLVPVVSFAQSGNNCISWRCVTPPDDCSYCALMNTSGNATCTPNGNDGQGCWVGGYCDTGTSGGCADATSCADYKDFWTQLQPPRSLRDEWQLVGVAVQPRVVRHSKRS
jgi:hypothetical protein